ncbi:MAG: glycosyltransferase [Proteobacteria bacterium]|nr:glycosyltransferase [Pseudomonadota bacterium]
MENADLPSVTIVIPVKPGLNPDAVLAIKELNYPKDKIEIITVYGKNPSKQRNEAVKLAKGEIIYFLDNDSMPEKDTLKRLIGHLKGDVVLAGGPSIMPEECPFGAFLFGKTLESIFSTGASRARYKRIGKVRLTGEKEIILCNMVMKRDIYLQFGGLNERLYPNEENELMEKLNHGGMKMVYDPDAVVIRMPRKTLKSFIKQIFNYGRGRGEQTFFYPKSFNILNFLPLLFLIYFMIAIIKGGYLLIPIIVYFTILFIDAFIKAFKENDFRYICIPFTTFLLHVTYGIGLIYGLLRAPFKKVNDGELRIEYIKI